MLKVDAPPLRAAPAPGGAAAAEEHAAAPSTRVTCAYCGDGLCVACGSPWDRAELCMSHTGHSCDEFAALVAAQGGKEKEHADFLATLPPEMAAVVGKPCPACGLVSAHYRGHGCHHVRQSQGVWWRWGAKQGGLTFTPVACLLAVACRLRVVQVQVLLPVPAPLGFVHWLSALLRPHVRLPSVPRLPKGQGVQSVLWRACVLPGVRGRDSRAGAQGGGARAADPTPATHVRRACMQRVAREAEQAVARAQKMASGWIGPRSVAPTDGPVDEVTARARRSAALATSSPVTLATLPAFLRRSSRLAHRGTVGDACGLHDALRMARILVVRAAPPLLLIPFI